jgi:pimeloyl-ACP methyl ester carboxylesterase
VSVEQHVLLEPHDEQIQGVSRIELQPERSSWSMVGVQQEQQREGKHDEVGDCAHAQPRQDQCGSPGACGRLLSDLDIDEVKKSGRRLKGSGRARPFGRAVDPRSANEVIQMQEEPMVPNGTAPGRTVQYLARPEGRVAYDVMGTGPLVLCVPGMGDLRSVYRFLAPALVDAGYRVATMDLRGHGDSDATFSSYDDVAAGTDIVALVGELAGPAVVVGNSMGAGAAAWAAAEAPDRVSGLVLIGPFVRQVPVGAMAVLAFRLALLRPWGRAAWLAYYPRLYPGRRPADFEAHRTRIRASLRQPGHWRAFARTTRSSHAPVEARLGEVRAPALVVMGERDPDFPDPAGEAELVARRLNGDLLMVPDAGHYPQAEYPEMVTPAVVEFLERNTQS